MSAAGAVMEKAGYPLHSQVPTTQAMGSETVTPPLPARPLTIDQVVAILVANGLCQ